MTPTEVREEIDRRIETATQGQVEVGSTMVTLDTLREWRDALADSDEEWTERTRKPRPDTAKLVVKGDEVSTSERTLDFLSHNPYDFSGWVDSVEAELTERLADRLPSLEDGTEVAELSVDFVSYTNERGDFDVTYEGRIDVQLDGADPFEQSLEATEHD